MARYANPFAAGAYPTDPSFAILGQSLGTALFGNPAARAEQELNNARIEQAEASARDSNAQADYRNGIIKARGNIGDVFRFLQPGQPPVAAPVAIAPQPMAAEQPPMEAPAFAASPEAYTQRGLVPPGPVVARPTDPNTMIVPPGLEGVASAIAQALPSETGGPAPRLVTGTSPPTANAAPEPSAVLPMLEAMGITPEVYRQHLPEIMAAMAQADMGGNLDEWMRTAAAFSGNDATARAGLIAGGATPGENFAITPQRADDIRDQGFQQESRIEGSRSADRRYSTDTRSRDSRYSTDTRSRDSRYGTDTRSADSRYGTDTRSGDSRYSTDARGESGGGTFQSPIRAPTRTVPGGEFGARRSYGGHSGRDESGVPARTPVYPMADGTVVRRTRTRGGGNEVEIRYLDGSRTVYKHLADGTTDHLRPGMEVGRNTVVGGVGNTGAASRGNHLHNEFYTSDGRRVDPRSVTGRGRAARPAQPRTLTRGAMISIDEEVDRRIDAAGPGGSGGSVTARARNTLRRLASEHYQRSGNPVTAVDQAYRQMLRAADRPRQQRAAAPAPRPAARPAAAQTRRLRYDPATGAVVPR